MAEKELEQTARLFRQLIRLCVQQELDERGIAPTTKPAKSTPGKVVRAKRPAEVARDRERKLSKALGLG